MPKPLPRRQPGKSLDPLEGLVTRTHPTPVPVPTPLDVQLRRVPAARPTTAHGWTRRLDLPPLTPSAGRARGGRVLERGSVVGAGPVLFPMRGGDRS